MAKTEKSYEVLLKEFKNLLKENSLRFTTQREITFKTLFEYEGHFTPEDLFNLIKKTYPNINIGMTTVYRTLNLVEENKFVTSISFGVQGKKYEFGLKPHHDHLICIKCGMIEEFEDETIEKLQEKIAKMRGFKMTGHIMQLYGICKNCQNQKN
jgi:Fur family ferric uptake transcriptional regulator